VIRRSSTKVALCLFFAALIVPGSARAAFIQAPGSPYTVGADPYGVSPGDFSDPLDSRLDLAAANGSSNSVSVLTRQATEGFVGTGPFSTGTGPNFAAVADFNLDGRKDVAVANFYSQSVTFLIGTGNGGFLPNHPQYPPIALGDQASAIVAGEFNGDTNPDLAVALWNQGKVAIRLNNGGAGFNIPAETVSVGTNPRYIVAADLNDTGLPDLGVANSGSDNVSTLMRNVAGTAFTAGPTIGVGDAPQYIVAADFTGDGKADLANTDFSSDTFHVIRRTGAGTFAAPAPFPAGDGPIGLAAAQLDDAPGIDLALVDNGEKTLRIYSGDNAGSFAPAGAQAISSGIPYGITAGNFGLDPHNDLAITTQGASGQLHVLLNTLGAPPVNTQKPVLSGSPKVGEQLSCSDGEWLENPTSFLKVWERAPRSTSADSDSGWIPIAGASGTTYAVQPGDAGQRVRCRVTAENAAGTGEASSNSIRTDTGPPANIKPPRVAGELVVPGAILTCEPGEWESDTSDFSYQWYRLDQPVEGATERTYKLTGSQSRGEVYNFNGDAGRYISCTVAGANDVGRSQPVRSNFILAIDGQPWRVNPPSVVLDQERSQLGRAARCSKYLYTDDYHYSPTDQTGQYKHRFKWFRDGQLIAGTDPLSETYKITVGDLGRRLSCSIRASNPDGASEDGSTETLVPLPPGTKGGRMFRAGGQNAVDPFNLLGITSDYMTAIDDLMLERYKNMVDDETERCKGTRLPPAGPRLVDFRAIDAPSDLRCWILVKDPRNVVISPTGVRWAGSYCFNNGPVGDFDCADLGFRLTPVDPSRPPAISAALQARLDAVTPETVLWDLDNDGDTDATCPGATPILRTIFSQGSWTPRAVIVAKDSAETGVFGSIYDSFTNPTTQAATQRNNYTAYVEAQAQARTAAVRPGPRALGAGAGRLRAKQVFACRTAIDPPPNADVGPCLKGGKIGRVQFEGNICPINVRNIDRADLAGMDASLVDQLTTLSDAMLEKGQHRAATDVYERLDPLASAAQAITLGPRGRALSGTYYNTSASLAGIVTRGGFNYDLPDIYPRSRAAQLTYFSKWQGVSGASAAKIFGLRDFEPAKAPFATDQVYIARGGLTVNGVNVKPKTGAALLIPSEADEASTLVKGMTLQALDAEKRLGTDVKLADGGTITKVFSDAPGTDTPTLVDGLDLDALRDDMEKVRRKLNLPFRLSGSDAKVTLNDDGTATLRAKAQIDLLRDSSGNPIRLDLVVRADRAGNLKLEGVKLGPQSAKLYALDLEDMILSYDSAGLDVRGKLQLISGQGIDLKQFHIGSDGSFALDVDYLGSPGIPLGGGVFLTRLGGAYKRLSAPERIEALDEAGQEYIRGGATVSVGPGTGGGCPTVGIAADMYVVFEPRFIIGATGQVQLLCIPLANIRFKAKSNYVELVGRLDWSLGPVFARGGLDFRYDGNTSPERWQAKVDAEVGIDIPLLGEVSEGGELVASNRGLAACAKIDLLFTEVAGGAGIRFPNGRPTLDLGQLISNLRFFTGCDLSSYKSFAHLARAAAGPPGSRSFTLPKGQGRVALSVEGAGGAPRIKLRSPSGTLYDFSTGEGARLPQATGIVIAQEDRTVVFLGKPEAGTWSAELAPGSPAIARISSAAFLPEPKVRAKVLGVGPKRILTYDVSPIAGQQVRFVEQAKGAVRTIKTVNGGGKGSVTFQPAEAERPQRKIFAEITQDGMPRDSRLLVSFRAPNPRVGRPGKVRVRRSGGGAVVTWSPAALAKRYELSVRTGDGGNLYFSTAPKRRRVSVPGIARGERVSVQIVAVSAAGREGPPGKATLRR
jgi:hypothetical protein